MADKKEHKRLTIAELRNFKGFEGYTDEQAEEAINTLEKLSLLFYKLHMKNKEVGKTFKLDHQQEINSKKLNKKRNNHESGKDGEQPRAA
jgi:hypothetical protein